MNRANKVQRIAFIKDPFVSRFLLFFLSGLQATLVCFIPFSKRPSGIPAPADRLSAIAVFFLQELKLRLTHLLTAIAYTVISRAINSAITICLVHWRNAKNRQTPILSTNRDVHLFRMTNRAAQSKRGSFLYRSIPFVPLATFPPCRKCSAIFCCIWCHRKSRLGVLLLIPFPEQILSIIILAPLLKTLLLLLCHGHLQPASFTE